MDKNATKFMLIMALIIFGFMLFSKKPEKQQEDESAPQAQTTAQSFQIDTIRPGEISDLKEVITKYGTLNQDGSHSYVTKNARLTYFAENDSLIGSVSTPNVTLQYEDVVASTYPETVGSTTVSQSDKVAAHEALRDAVREGHKYGQLASFFTASSSSKSARLANDVISLEISSKGGKLSKAVLNNYFTYFPSKANPEVIDTAKVVMFSPADDWFYNLELQTKDRATINTNDLYFTPKYSDDSTSVTMAVMLGEDSYWGYRYTLPQGDSYIVKMEVVSHNMQNALANIPDANLHWNLEMARQERGRTFEERNSSIYYKRTGHGPDDLGAFSEEKEVEEPLQWIAFKNQFFSTIIMPDQSFHNTKLIQRAYKDDPGYVKGMEFNATVDFSTGSETLASFDIFIGPNLYPLLKNVDKELASEDSLDFTRLIPLGWSWLRWINTLIIIPIFTFLSSFISNYGLIILLLTIIIKIILFPFTYKSYMSQAKMRLLAPEIKEINEKYPGQENAMLRQQKTMALYSRAGASPMSGCLPMLLQLPILIAMFSFFPSCIELRGQSFLWAQDLAAPDSVLTLPFTIPFYGNHVSLFCLLMTVVNIVYTRINMQNQPGSSSMPGMKWMMYLMPVMFLFFFNDYAAALSYYYLLSLLITIIQTYIFRRCVNEEKLRKKMAENAAKPRKKSGFMARLEEAQRKQQAALKQQQQQRNRGRRN